jgi:glycosyltransferase involved in cell wall biosynthesis
MIEAGESGYLYPSGDRDALRGTLLALWNDKDGQRRMGRVARGLIETRYSQERRTTSLLNIYRSLAAPRVAATHSFEPAAG